MTKEKLQLKILTPLGSVCDVQVDQVTATTTSGEITILPNHVPIVTTLKVGEVMTRTDGEPVYYSITGGVLEKRHDNSVVILASRSEMAGEIDIERAQEAYEKAQQMMEEAEANPNLVDHSNLQEVLAKEFNRVRVGQKGLRK